MSLLPQQPPPQPPTTLDHQSLQAVRSLISLSTTPPTPTSTSATQPTLPPLRLPHPKSPQQQAKHFWNSLIPHVNKTIQKPPLPQLPPQQICLPTENSLVTCSTVSIRGDCEGGGGGGYERNRRGVVVEDHSGGGFFMGGVRRSKVQQYLPELESPRSVTHAGFVVDGFGWGDVGGYEYGGKKKVCGDDGGCWGKIERGGGDGMGGRMRGVVEMRSKMVDRRGDGGGGVKVMPMMMGCGKGSRKTSGVLKTITRARKRKTFVCACGSAFGQRSHLTAHISTVHNKERNYVCGICDFRFGTRSNLNSHISAVHYRIKRFSCASCEASFAKSSNLKKHRMAVHRLR